MMFLLSVLISLVGMGHSLTLDDNMLFPTLPVAKDGMQSYFVHANVGNTQPQQMIIDLMLPYTTLISGRIYPECNNPYTNCTGGGLYFPERSPSHLNISDSVYNLTALSHLNFTYTLGSDVLTLPTVRYNTENSVNLGDTQLQWDLTWGSLNFTRASFFETELSTVISCTLGLGGKIFVNSDVMDSDRYDSSFYFLEMAKNAELISSCSYSLWLGNDEGGAGDFVTVHEGVGSLVLGAVDPQYYVGDLFQYDMLPYRDSITDVVSRNYPIIPLTKVNLINSTGAFTNLTGPSFKEPVLLDTKSAVSYLPPELFTQVASQTRGYYDRSMGLLFVDCSVADINATLSFEFGNASIHVPLSYFITAATSVVSENKDRFNQTCTLKISPNSEVGFTILGRAFLRSVYLAMDLEGLTIGIAQSRNANDTVSSSSSALTPAAISPGKIPYAKTASVDDSLTLSVLRDTVGVRGSFNGTIRTETGASKTFYTTPKASSTTVLSSTTLANASGHYTMVNQAHTNRNFLQYHPLSLTPISIVTGGFIALGTIVVLGSLA